MSQRTLTLKLREDVENVECEDVTIDEVDEMIAIGEDMIKFAVDNGGIGLSGPQVGIHKKIIVWQGRDGNFQIGFNPSIITTGKSINTAEGCLSYPDEQYFLEGRRAKYINGIYYAPNKERTELVRVIKKMREEEAIVFSHETDHINGITIAMIGMKIE